MMALIERFFEQHLVYYWKTRQWSRLWKGFPAVIFLAVGVAAVAAVRRPDDSKLATRYEKEATAARDGSNKDAEDLCWRRLLVLQPTDPRTRYEYAAALARHDEEGKAMRIMQSLAPLNRSGYAPAQYWLAEKTINRRIALSREEAERLEERLEFSLVGRDALPAARLTLIEMALRTQNWAVAGRHLEAVVPRRSDLLMTLASVYRQQGNESRANLNASRATDFYSGIVRQNPKDDANRLRWAETLVFQGKLKAAIEVLQSADGAETDPRYGAAIAQVFLMRMKQAATTSLPRDPIAPVDALLPDNRPLTSMEVASKIELLERALHYAPQDPKVLAVVAQLSVLDTADGEQARSWLKDVLARGDAPAIVHLILGTNASIKGDFEQAGLHLTLAHRLDPKMAAAANNLAFVMARTDPPQTEQALQLVDAALQVIPNHPEFVETRCQILLKLGRTQEAVQDLEVVLKKLPGRPDIHLSLANAYQSLGDQDLAERHKRMAESIKNNPATSKKQR